MINSFSVSNFKCIDEAKIEFKPITIFSGPNSSGKSSISQALLLLKQSVMGIGGIHTLFPRGGIIDLGSFPDMIRSHNVNNILEYKIDIDVGRYYTRSIRKFYYGAKKYTRRPLPIEKISTLNCDINYTYIPEEEKIVLDNVSFIEDSNFLIESRKNKTGTFRFVYGNIGPDKRTKWSNPELNSLTDFFAPQPSKGYLLSERLSYFKSEKLYNLKRLISGYLDILSNELEMINYLGPFRQTPIRYYMTGGAMPSDIGYKGESSIDYLSYMKMSGDNEIIRFTGKWLQKMGYTSHFDIETIKAFIKTVKLKNKNSNVESSLVDVGFGISQVLPVIIAVCRHNYGIHIFEQPELHLHPKSQGDIADLFIENISNNVRFVIETHSEHLLNRIRRRVAEGKISPDDIKIYFIFQDGSKFKVNDIGINEAGSFSNYPPNFFDEAYQESKKIVEASISKRKH
jgi:AAA15 family ATPase/GTPase